MGSLSFDDIGNTFKNIFSSDDDTDVDATDKEKALASIAKKKYERYEEIFQPSEDAFISTVQSIDEGDADLAAGRAAASSQQAHSQASDEVESAQMQSGAAPGSGRFNESIGDVGRDQARSRGLGLGSARRSTTDRRLSGQQAISAIGQGQEAESLDTIADVARESNREAVEDARMSAANRATNAQAAGTVAGAGLSYADFGDTANPSGVGGNTPNSQPYNASSSRGRRVSGYGMPRR